MKKGGVLNRELSTLIACMGHTDMITVCDSGLPIPTSVERIDLAVSPGIPSFLDVLQAIAVELKVEEIIFAEELQQHSQSLMKSVQDLFPNSSVKTIPHENFKKMSKESKAIVRSGETTPYANVILVSGVIF
jgi:D-ribose pyranase